MRARIACLAFVAALSWAGPIGAAEVRVMAANAVKVAYAELVAGFERSTGHTVTTLWGGTEAIDRRIRGGEEVDIVIVASPAIDRLILDGKLVAGSRRDFARSGIGVAVRGGLPGHDISSADAVRRAVLEADSVAYSSGPSGFYLADLFSKMGIADQIRHKLRQPASGVQVGELLARGDAELGFQQISELLHFRGIRYLGPLPPEIQTMTIYSAALHGAARSPDLATALIRALTAPDAKAILEKSGMQPGE